MCGRTGADETLGDGNWREKANAEMQVLEVIKWRLFRYGKGVVWVVGESGAGECERRSRASFEAVTTGRFEANL
jgi:hypothetical protein